MKQGIERRGLSKRWPEILLILAVGIALAWVSSAAATEIYMWTDQAGIVHYSDLPPKNRESRKVFVEGSYPSRTTGADPSLGKPADRAASPIDDEDRQLSAAEQRRKQIVENQEARKASDAVIEKMCGQHRQRLAKMEPARRVYYTDPQGENIRLDDDQRMGLIEESKDYIAKFCK